MSLKLISVRPLLTGKFKALGPAGPYLRGRRNTCTRAYIFPGPTLSRPSSPEIAQPLHRRTAFVAGLTALGTSLVAGPAEGAEALTQTDQGLGALVTFSLLLFVLFVLLSLMIRTAEHFDHHATKTGDHHEPSTSAHDEKRPLDPLEEAHVRSYIDPRANGHLVRDPRLQALASAAAHTVVTVAKKAKEARISRTGHDVIESAEGAEKEEHEDDSQAANDQAPSKSWISRVTVQAALLEVQEVLAVYHKWEKEEKVHV